MANHAFRAAVAVALWLVGAIGPASAQQAGAAARDPALLERGRYLIEIAAACGVCHTTRDAQGRPVPGMEQAGGRVFAERGFRAVAPNITPDPERGIGRWTDAQVLRAITLGASADGRRLAPPMGGRAPIWARLTERDRRDLLAYLRSLPPQEP